MALEAENAELKKEVSQLKRELNTVREQHDQELDKLIFLLIGIGLSGRLIACIIRSVFNMPANHSDILKKAQVYAVKATQIMETYFQQMGVVAAIDEVFIENLPVYIAVSPQSLLICNAGVYEERTEENWTKFLDEMGNLQQTVSDRGISILAAIAKRGDHCHQSDVFHCMHTVKKELLKMERHCYSLIGKEEKADIELQKRKTSGRDARGHSARLRKARNDCEAAITLFDDLEQAVNLAFKALRISDGFTLNTAEQARQDLEFASEWIQYVHPCWRKVVSALRDKHLLHYLEKVRNDLDEINVETTSMMDREHVLAVLTYLWEVQAPQRWQGKKVQISEIIRNDLERCCSNLDHVFEKLITVLESQPKASSSVESINSRVGFFRYSKRRFSDDFANLISVVHNMTPFMNGKRKGKSPAEIENVNLPTMDIFELFGIA